MRARSDPSVQDSQRSRHIQHVENVNAVVDVDPTEGVAMPASTDTDATRDDATRDDAAWFTGLVREHSTAVVRYFARRGPRQDAEDLAAEVFATAWRRRDDIPSEAELPWLYRTAGFTLANHRRKHVDLPVEELPEKGRPRVADDPELSALFDAELRGALASVGERDRRDPAAARVGGTRRRTARPGTRHLAIGCGRRTLACSQAPS